MPPPDSPPRPVLPGLAVLLLLLLPPPSLSAGGGEELAYLWPLPAEFTTGADTLSVDPALALVVGGNGGGSRIVKDAFDRYKSIIFQHSGVFSIFNTFRKKASGYDIGRLRIVVRSANEELQLGVDESYTLLVTKSDGKSMMGEATIEANTVYGALRGLEKFMVYKKTEGALQAKCKLVLGTTFYAANSQFSSTITHFCVRGITFSQLCTFDYSTKLVLVHKAPWYIRDEPRFAYRGLLLDTSRHYYPIDMIKHILDSMSYAKLNVLHWHIIDEESFPLEVPTYPKLWQGAYTRWERYTVEDAYEIVNFAKSRGIHVMPEVDVPGHAESWGKGYPELWPSTSCREPLDVSKSTTFDLISGLLSDMRKIFPFELFHLGGDEVNTDCWTSTPHVKQWLQNHNMTSKDAYKYFVLKAQEIAISKNWTPVNWEETFNAFPESLNPKTIVHNWLGAGVCPKAVAKGFKCIFSNQGFWYLHHLDVPWDQVYTAEPLEGISDASKQKLVIGGEVCMWGEITDTSNVQQTIWPRAAAAAERLWSRRDAISSGNINKTALPRLHYFRCLLNGRGVAAAPVTNQYARSQPNGPASCYAQ